MINLNLFDIVFNRLPSFLSNSFWSLHFLAECVFGISDGFHDFSILSICVIENIILYLDFLVINWFFLSDDSWFGNLDSLNLNWFRSLSGVRKRNFLLVSSHSWLNHGISFWCNNLDFIFFFNGKWFGLSCLMNSLDNFCCGSNSWGSWSL